MFFREIELFDIRHNPTRVNEVITDNAKILSNQLYVLVEGNHVVFDEDTLKALQSLKNYLQRVLDKQPKVCYNELTVEGAMATLTDKERI